jgi:hypothetical protein
MNWNNKCNPSSRGAYHSSLPKPSNASVKPWIWRQNQLQEKAHLADAAKQQRRALRRQARELDEQRQALQERAEEAMKERLEQAVTQRWETLEAQRSKEIALLQE